MKSYTLKELASILGAEIRGDEALEISSVATLEHATQGQLSLLANAKYRAQLQNTQASAVLISAQDVEGFTGNALVLNDPYVGFARVAQLLDTTPKSAIGIHDSAVIHP